MQSINLLKGLPTKQVSLIPLQLFNMIVVGWIGFWILIYFIMSLINFAFNYQHQSLIRKRDEARTKIEELASNRKSNPQEGQLGEILSKLEARIKEKEQILYFLETKKTEEFSGYLKALSDLSQKNLWLTEINIEPTKHVLTLGGLATEPDAPLVYVKAMDKSALLSKYELFVNGIVKNQEDFFQFAITNTPGSIVNSMLSTDLPTTDKPTTDAQSKP